MYYEYEMLGFVMILSKVLTTQKQKTEFGILISIRFACLLSKVRNPMDCPRVQRRLAKLNHYLKYNTPSKLFFRSYCNQTGELGMTFSLRVQDFQTAVVYREHLSESTVVNISRQQQMMARLGEEK